MAWNLVNQSISQVVGAAVFLFLAAQLSPAVFGVFALAVLVVDVFAAEARTAFVDLLVLRRDFTARALTTALVAFSAAMGLAYIALVAAAPALAHLFAAPDLARVLPVLGVALLLAPPLGIYEALLVRDLRFGALAARNVVATLGASALAVGCVLVGPREWALVVQRLAILAISLLGVAMLAPWRPEREFDAGLVRAAARPFLKIWAGQLLNFALGRAPDLIIGLRFGPGPLGVYRIAVRVVEIVQSAVTTPLVSVFIPVLARHGRDLERQREDYLQITALSALVSVPLLTGLALVAGDLAAVAFDARYQGAAPLIALLAAAGLVIPFAYFRGVVLVAMSRPGLAAALAVLDLLVTLGAAWTGSAWGVHGAVAGILAASGVGAIVAVAAVQRSLDLRLPHLVQAIAPAYLAAASMALGVLLVQAGGADWPPAGRLAASTTLGAAIFAAHVWLLHRGWFKARIAYLTNADR